MKIWPLICALILSGCMSIHSPKEFRVGGPCEYEYHPGVGRIVSINPLPDGKRFEVSFEFYREDNSREERTHFLYDNHFQHPSREFLEKNNITVGKVIPGYLMSITKGTCTPILFSFPRLKDNRAP